MKEGEVFEINGLEIGVVKQCVHGASPDVYTEPVKPTFEELQQTIRVIESKPTPPLEEFEEEGNPCALCKNTDQLYKYFEDGIEYAICSACAIKARKNPRKMERL